MSDVFSRLAPFIREYIYSHGWTELKSIQGDAIHAILDDDRHILISAGTASGKTEAAFFPVLSQLAMQQCSSVSVLYIGPLKALINDQFERLNDLLLDADIKVWRWHGDVSASHKKKLLDNPSGILQITPESLEAMMLRHSGDTIKLFSNLQYIVIDEVHAFMGSDRGGQLLCQISKIERWAKCEPRRIGLSATLGDPDQAARWLCLGSEKDALQISEGKTKKQIRLAVDWFEEDTSPEESDSPNAEKQTQAYYQSIYNQCFDTKSIVFTNSRSEAEDVIAHMREIAENMHAPDIFHVHHGNISKILRTEAEQAMREQEGPTVTAATLTLELGIDIGKLERIIQVGAPYSCSSFVQRLGRSGRRTGISEMYFTYLDKPPKDDNLLNSIPWPLIQMIAIIQLYIEERWIEPANRKPLPFSLLYHQTMGMLATMGELTPSELARNVLTLPSFSNITQEDYRKLLLHLLDIEHIQKTDEDTLIIGLKGEPVVNHFTFYAVFPDEEEYTVSCDGRELGSINVLPPEQVCITLAGRFWKVIDLDVQRKHIFVKPAKKSFEKLWRPNGGGDIHTKIVQRMHDVLSEAQQYPYLFERAQIRLEQARKLVKNNRYADNHFVELSEGNYMFTPWIGQRGMRTFNILFRDKEIQNRLNLLSVSFKDYSYFIRSGLSLQAFQKELAAVLQEPISLEKLVNAKDVLPIDKYDYLLPTDLLIKQYVQNMLDLNEIRELFG